MLAGLEQAMPQPRVQIAQALVSRADGGKALRMVFRRVLANELEIAAANGLIVGIVGQSEHFVRVGHVVLALASGVRGSTFVSKVHELVQDTLHERIDALGNDEVVAYFFEPLVALGMLARQRLGELFCLA